MVDSRETTVSPLCRRAMVFLAFIIVIAVSSIGALAGQLRASVVKVDITPDKPQWLLGYAPRQSTGIHDHLFHRIVAMDDGKTQFYLISTDICLASPSVYDEVTQTIEQQTGIKPSSVWWTFTHTHAAPEIGPPGMGEVFLGTRYNHDHNTEYSAWAKQQLIQGVKDARDKLQPARLVVGWGYASASINRRAHNEEGEDFLGLNPDGPVDHQIGLIRLEKADGSLLALIANYAMHGTALGGENPLISGDAPGVVAEYVEEKLGAPMLYIQGAAGNQAPIYTVQKDFKAAHLDAFKVLLGDHIIAANAHLGPASPEVELTLGQQIVESPRKEGLAWPADLGNYTRTTSAGVNMIRMPIHFLLINHDTAIWTAPLELFVEVSMGVREHSPFPYTFYFGYANGWLGYLPSKEEFASGGYEPHVSAFTPEGGPDLARVVETYLSGKAR